MGEGLTDSRGDAPRIGGVDVGVWVLPPSVEVVRDVEGLGEFLFRWVEVDALQPFISLTTPTLANGIPPTFLKYLRIFSQVHVVSSEPPSSPQMS